MADPTTSTSSSRVCHRLWESRKPVSLSFMTKFNTIADRFCIYFQPGLKILQSPLKLIFGSNSSFFEALLLHWFWRIWLTQALPPPEEKPSQGLRLSWLVVPFTLARTKNASFDFYLIDFVMRKSLQITKMSYFMLGHLWNRWGRG